MLKSESETSLRGAVKEANTPWENFRTIFLVSNSNSEAYRKLKSFEKIRQEQIRHILGNYRTIHPYSKFRSCWNLSMSVVIYTLTVVDTFVLTFEQKDTSYATHINNLKWLLLFFNAVLIFDIGINFHTGYYDKETKSIRLERRAIAEHYLKGKFWVHVIFSIPWFFFAQIYESVTELNKKEHVQYKLRDYFSIASFTRFFRYGEITEFLALLERSSIKNKLFWRILKVILDVTTILHLSACFILNIYCIMEEDMHRQYSGDSNSWMIRHAMNDKYTGNVWSKYVHCLYRAAKAVMLHGSGSEKELTQVDRNLAILFRFIGVGCFLYYVSCITLIVHTMYAGDGRLQTIEQYVFEMARHKRLSPRTVKRMLLYFKFKCEGEFFNETKLMGMLSPNLQKEIKQYFNEKLVRGVPMFEVLPNSIIDSIVTRLQSDVYLPGDILIKIGTHGTAVTFLVNGKVQVRKNVVMEILQDGSFFGEAVLVSSDLRVEEVIALVPCEVQILKKEDFIEILQPYPELLEKVTQFYIENQTDEHYQNNES